MSVRPMVGFDFGAMVDAGLLADEAAEDGWHALDGYWHASSLGDCTRAAVLKRAGLGTDGTPRSGQVNFALGHAIHDSVERWARAYAALEPRFRLLEVEVGARDERLRLKARPDMICAWEGEPCLLEIKSERSDCPVCKRGGAAAWRQREAAERGYATPVKYEHWLQMTASAMVRERATELWHPKRGWRLIEADGPRVGQGRALYVGKNDWFFDSVPVDLDDAIMRAAVVARVQELDAAWAAYERDGALPRRIAPSDRGSFWRCDTRSARERQSPGDPRGRYCSARSACVARGWA